MKEYIKRLCVHHCHINDVNERKTHLSAGPQPICDSMMVMTSALSRGKRGFDYKACWQPSAVELHQIAAK